MGSSNDVTAIPLIDVAPLVKKIDDPDMANDKDLLRVVLTLDYACKEVGFFYVLPHEEKMKIKMTRQSGYRGYQKLGENVTKEKRDMHEAVNCLTPIAPGKYGDLGKTLEGDNLWPEYPSNLKVVLENYISLVKDLSRKIMRGIALALGGPADAFERGIAGDPYWALRLVSYPVSSSDEKRTDDTGMMGSHTDYGLVTLVNQDDDICALEVQNRSGVWIRANPIPETFLCNIGDMLQFIESSTAPINAAFLLCFSMRPILMLP
uniref:Uncharacterized protein n=1 Tax=Zea mays TaxID=4577 RepID=A0A804RDF0_MAIZE